MSQKAQKISPRKGGCLLAAMLALAPSICRLVLANPQGMSVARGHAAISRAGAQLNVTVSQNAVIDWQSFNIAAGETTAFQQPSSKSVLWNRIFDSNPSRIWGNLNANGIVVLMNQNGFYFGPNSSVNVGGFVAAAVPVAPPATVGGGLWEFAGSPPLASIINYGQLRTHGGGPLYLVSEVIENHGTLSAPGGKVGLYAGKKVLLSERPDGRGLSVEVQLPAGSVDNHGKIVADAGDIASRAQGMGGIGTARGGNVTIRAGRDIVSRVSNISALGGGDLHLTAGRDIIGQFLLRTGAGGLTAGRNVGSAATPATLGLVSGGWTRPAMSISMKSITQTVR